MNNQDNNFKLYVLFIFSYIQFINILIATAIFTVILLISILQHIFIDKVDINKILTFFVEPILFCLVISTPIVSFAMNIYYWIDINNNNNIELSQKIKVKRIFITNVISINSYYYDYKYTSKLKSHLFSFLQKTRNKIFGSKNKLNEMLDGNF